MVLLQIILCFIKLCCLITIPLYAFSNVFQLHLRFQTSLLQIVVIENREMAYQHVARGLLYG